MRFSAAESWRNSRLPPKSARASRSPAPTRCMNPISACTGPETRRASAAASSTATSTAPAATASASALAPPHPEQEVGLRRDRADDPDQVVAHAERRGRREVVGAVVAETRSGGTPRRPRAGGVRAGDRRRYASTSGSPASASVRSCPASRRAADAILRRSGWARRVSSGGEQEDPRVLADRQLGDEVGERVQVEIDAEHPAEPAAVVHRGGAGDAGHALVVEDVGRQPDEPALLLRLEVERPGAGVVAAVLVAVPRTWQTTTST